jgi:hypothetical protein
MKKLLSLDCELTEEYVALAVSSHMKDYKLCWVINQLMHIDFKRLNDFKYFHSKNSKIKYSIFSFKDEVRRCTVTLLSNKKTKTALITKLQNFDYLLFLKEECGNSGMLEHLQKELRNIQNILMLQMLDLSTNRKEMNALLNDIELHQIESDKQNKQESINYIIKPKPRK